MRLSLKSELKKAGAIGQKIEGLLVQWLKGREYPFVGNTLSVLGNEWEGLDH